MTFNDYTRSQPPKPKIIQKVTPTVVDADGTTDYTVQAYAKPTSYVIVDVTKGTDSGDGSAKL